MRTLFALGALAGMSSTCSAAGNVAVYISNINAPQGVVERAKQVSARMFATAGVTIDWRSGPRPAGGGIAITLERSTDPGYHKGALAFARPYEGVHIVVFYDRVVTGMPDNISQRAMVLAHVMTHEITHVIQRCEWHSASGVMKARWDFRDFRDMTFAP